MKIPDAKRISLTVEAEPYEDLRRLGDLAGFNPDWISLELNHDKGLTICRPTGH